MNPLSMKRRLWRAWVLVLLVASFPLVAPKISGAADIPGTLASGPVAEQCGPMIRTWEVMQKAPLGPALAKVPLRPTVGEAEYRTAKTRAARTQTPARRATAAPVMPPPVVVKNYDGVNQTTAGNRFPPDSGISVGTTQYVQIVNSYIVVYSKTTDAVDKQATLAQLFGYTTQPLFNPRVIYDSVWKRWIVTAVALPESSTVMRMFVGVSLTPYATDSFRIYSFNAAANPDDFFDFPMVGYDQDAIFVTGNVFNNATGDFLYARMYHVAKAKVYNGLAANWRFFDNLAGTLAAPIAPNSQNAWTWFASPQLNISTPADSYIRLYRFQNLSRGFFASAAGPYDVAVAGIAIPADANQTGGEPLDTLDCRFQNVSTQVTIGSSTSLFNVHCVSYSETAGGIPTPQWYELDVTDPSAPTIRQKGQFWAIESSEDFNPHIAVNSAGNCFVVWSATDPSHSRNAMVYYGGRRHSYTLGIMGVRAEPLFISAVWYDDGRGQPSNRWGGYSAVAINPSNSSQAWLTNEIILGTSSPSTLWGTRISLVKY